jgi:hypothetical protein
MNIDPINGVGSVNKSNSPSQSNRSSTRKVEGDSIEFTESIRLDSMLEDSKDVRNDKIEKAANLIGKVDWPPPEVIRRISNLIASKLKDGSVDQQSLF